MTGDTDLSLFIPPLRGLSRIGILGGSFDPPHLGHVFMALAAYATEELDHLWVIPCADHAFGKSLSPFADRVRMCHLAFRHFAGGVAVLDVESRLPVPSYTIDTLRALLSVRPEMKPVLIVGSDVVPELPRWKDSEEILQLSRLVVIPRAGHQAETRIRVPIPDVSSTELRARLRAGEDASGFLDRDVMTYIRRRGLYGPG